MPIANVDPTQAYEILSTRNDAVLIDVRSKVEFDYVGHPLGALHIPWAEFPAWTPEPDAFVAQVFETLGDGGAASHALPILLICRSGARSMKAAQALEQAGFSDLYNVAEGFEGDKDAARHRGTINGWRFRRLPWEQT